MHLTDLRYFQTIARCGNITGAARLLGVRQPSLTVAMQRLEAETGTTLLLRDRSGVTLTSTGHAFLQMATDILALLDAGLQRIRALESDEVGSFTLGFPAVSSYFLASFFTAFLQEAPRITLSLWTGSTHAVQQAVLAREVDFGIVVNPARHPELVLMPLFHDACDFFVLAPPHDTPGTATAPAPRPHWAWDTACTLLRRGPLVYVTSMPQAQTMMDRLGASGLLPARQLPCDDLELAKSLAVAGVGVTILPRRVAASDPLRRLHRLHPALPWVHDVISLAYRADGHRTRAALRLKEALIAHGRRLGTDTESQRIQQELQEARAVATDREHGMQGNE
jgi:DNA-binding transcriptional LysR family regulator